VLDRNRLQIMALNMILVTCTFAPVVGYGAPAAFHGRGLEKNGPSSILLVKDCDTLEEKQQCCSAKNCGGKVLSNRDAHNCKDISEGKSWHPASKNGDPARCTNL
jgi:hypothetical protein